jgi:Phage integrase, N-terminal SAM-like domain
MIEDMNARKLCAGTQRGHILSCKRFAAFLKRSPDTATLEDIRRFQLHLAQTGVSICTRNRTMTGLRFLFRVTLRRLDLAEEVYHIREPQDRQRKQRRPDRRPPSFRRDPFARDVLFDPGGTTLHMLRSAISDSLRSHDFIIRGSIAHPTQPVCTLRVRRCRRLLRARR